ncbi:hypothetical protein GGI07_004474 [Coemansia sp. Benny D115]|nr:hypothetical protein GGI07_004474 [Coemansia sp. Benny D115]
MDSLAELIARCEEGGNVEFTADQVIGYLDRAQREPANRSFSFAIQQAKKELASIDSLTGDDVLELVNVLYKQAENARDADTDAPLAPDVDAGVAASDEQAVPQATMEFPEIADSRPFDTRRRTHMTLGRRNSPGSALEGSRLRQRNVAKMSDTDFDAMAESIEPELVDNITGFFTETRAAGGSTRVPAINTSFGRAQELQSLFVHDQVPRRVIRNYMKTVPGAQPMGGVYDVAPSPESSIHEGVSTVPEALSPTRYTALDDTMRKSYDTLLGKRVELQKQLNEKERRVEFLETQLEQNKTKLENAIDEKETELSMKKREIERLRFNERSHQQNLKIAEGEVERLGVSLSNVTAQLSDQKTKCEKQRHLNHRLEKMLADYQSQISKLKANLSANLQQQEQASQEYAQLELSYREMQHELKGAQEYKTDAEAAQRENQRLNESIEVLHTELQALRQRAHQMDSGSSDAKNAGSAPGSVANSLQEELWKSGASDMLAVDDAVAAHDDPSTMDGSNSSAAAQQAAMRRLVSQMLSKFSSEDLVILREVWNRIDYCDKTAKELTQLRHELLSVCGQPSKLGLKEALRGLNNPTLIRIVDNVVGDCSRSYPYGGMSGAANSQRQQLGKGGKGGLAQLLSNGQNVTVLVIVYSVVIFCLGIITARYLNLAQPSMGAVTYTTHNGTMVSTIKGAEDGSMNMVRQILVADEEQAPKYYSLRKRHARSRLGDALFYWLEALFWDEGAIHVPT